MKARIDWGQIGDRVCDVLDRVYVKQAKQFRMEAQIRGIGVEQLAAAAITQMLRRDLACHRRRLNAGLFRSANRIGSDNPFSGRASP